MKTKTQSHYPDVQPNPDFPKIEEKVLAQWKAENSFEKSVENRKDAEEYVFYDGPPFANGLPHYGHLLTGFVKDLYARYHTMKGERVERRFGWDCHGLPAEMGAEKELKISGRKAIEDFGIEKFNEHCRSSVMKYAGDWETYVDRQARWVDFAGDYKTMDTNFMESVIWAFKQLYDKGLVYQSHRVMPYSWAAETPLSNFETKLDDSYRNKTDKAVTVKFKLKEVPKIITDHYPETKEAHIMAWTTTPWTLPSNLALAASEELGYNIIFKNDKVYILSAKAREDAFVRKNKGDADWKEFEFEKNGQLGVVFDGSHLIGSSYEPLFPYFKDHPNAFRVLDGSSFIEEGSGTGIVHMAPGFGEDDQRVCAENDIAVTVPVDEKGCYTDEIFDIEGDTPIKLAGLNVIAQTEGQCDGEPYTPDQLAKYGLVNLRIINWLKLTGHLVKQEDYNHNYPHCWRTDMPLIYRAMPSWYVEVTKIRDRAVELNRQINWIPSHIRDGQMEHMLNTAPDWSISRNRFWGTPIPVWRRMDSDEIKVFGSIAELEEFFDLTDYEKKLGEASRPSEPSAREAARHVSDSSRDSGRNKITDLHRPYIDELKTAKDGSEWERVSDVFDCWFESGSMPFAQVHYPFENKEWFETHFPADFITEYVGQTRGWFNTLIILATALFDKPPFKNCICHGVVLDSETGLKYSKRLKNYKNPLEVIDQFGADALRWLMMDSSVMRGADLSVDPEGKFIRDVVRLHIKPIWNAYNFFMLYANADGVKAECDTSSDNLMDRYILAKCREAVEKIEAGLDAYDTPTACAAVSDFFEVLNNWYIRRNKERFWNESSAEIDQAAFNTLYTVQVTMCKAAAPLLPYTLEEIYSGLVGGESVHLADFPNVDSLPQAGDLIADMDRVRDACNVALSIRSAENQRVRQPLAKLTLIAPVGAISDFKPYLETIMGEVNVKDAELKEVENISDYADYNLKLNNKVLGKRLPAKMKQIIPASKQGKWELKEGDLIIEGETLLPEEYDLQLQPKDGVKGAAALSTNDALVVLDLHLTAELKAEGVARDLVRMVQEARKQANLQVSDRIALQIKMHSIGYISAAIEANKNYICGQVLALSLELGEVSATHRFEQELKGEQIVFGFTVA